jgi:hypothetical protein
MNSVAELKVLILRQQELAAKLARTDQMPGVRAARSKLFGLLNQLDLAQDVAGTKRPANSPSERHRGSTAALPY